MAAAACARAPDAPPPGLKAATFAGGCFWGLELAYQRVSGVTATSVGYTGGPDPAPTYETVCAGVTGHAEAVQVYYDPAVASYADLLAVFFDKVDPTTPNRQGNDVGTQYRSAIYYHDDEQKAEAEKVRGGWEGGAAGGGRGSGEKGAGDDDVFTRPPPKKQNAQPPPPPPPPPRSRPSPTSTPSWRPTCSAGCWAPRLCPSWRRSAPTSWPSPTTSSTCRGGAGSAALSRRPKGARTRFGATGENKGGGGREEEEEGERVFFFALASLAVGGRCACWVLPILCPPHHPLSLSCDAVCELVCDVTGGGGNLIS